jgi:N utilization substance protein B
MKRRSAREYALQFLYGIDCLDGSASERVFPHGNLPMEGALSLFWDRMPETDPDIKVYAEDIIKGSIKHLLHIDAIIEQAAEKWRLVRMATVDRNILRFATYELLYRDDIPSAVIINEAIEIAKKFSASESASFINGILDKIAKEHLETLK